MFKKYLKSIKITTKRVISLGIICCLILACAIVGTSLYSKEAEASVGATAYALNIDSPSLEVLTNNINNATTGSVNLHPVSVSQSGKTGYGYVLEENISNGTYNETILESSFPSGTVLKLLRYAESMSYLDFNATTSSTLSSELEYKIATNLAVMFVIKEHVIKYRINWDSVPNNIYKQAAQKLLDRYMLFNEPNGALRLDLSSFRTLHSTDGSYNYYGPFNLLSGTDVTYGSSVLTFCIVNEAKTPVTVLNTGVTYYIRAPISGAQLTDFTFNAVGEQTVLRTYGVGTGRFVCTDKETKQISELVPFVEMNNTAAIRVLVFDSITGEPINGGVFKVTNLSGEVANFTVVNNGAYLTGNLPAGSYEVTQLSAGTGYAPSSFKQTVNISDVNKIYEIEFTNTKDSGKLKLSLSAIQSGYVGEGVFRVYDMSDTLVREFTTAHGVAEVALNDGNYYVKQVTAPSGYLVDPNNHYFTIFDCSTENVSISMYSTSQPQAHIKVFVRDAETWTPIPYGGLVELYKDEVYVGEFGIGADGTVITGVLNPGAYKVVQKTSNTDYAMTSLVVEVAVTTTSLEEVVTFYNIRVANNGQPLPPVGNPGSNETGTPSEGKVLDDGTVIPFEELGSIKVTLDGDDISKVSVKLYESNKKTRVATAKTNSKGVVTFEDLVAGTYYVVVPSSMDYATVSDGAKVRVSEGRQSKTTIDMGTYSFVATAPEYSTGVDSQYTDISSLPVESSVPSEPLSSIVTVKIVCTAGGKPLPNVEVIAMTASQRVLVTGKTNANGTITFRTDVYADYYFVQKSVPAGYTLDSLARKIVIDGTQSEVLIEFKN